jgi:ribosomal protein S18 acetylase RimI-like enzyme
MSSPAARVRPFDLRTDMHRVLAFHVDLIETYFPARGLMDGGDYDRALRDDTFKSDGEFKKALEGADPKNNGIFVWDNGGIIVGYTWLALRHEPVMGTQVGVIREIYLVPEMRGSGLADKMMNYALDWFRVHGAKIHRLDVTSSNDRAIKFYEKFGFKVFRVEMERMDE